jgi:excisionase family DNA binding protein
MNKRTRTMPPVEPLLLTIPQVATMLELGRTKVYDLIEREGLPSIKLGTARRVPVKALQEWLEQRQGKSIA